MDIKSVKEGAETKMILRSIAYDNGFFFGMNVMNSAVTKELDEWRLHEEYNQDVESRM